MTTKNGWRKSCTSLVFETSSPLAQLRVLIFYDFWKLSNCLKIKIFEDKDRRWGQILTTLCGKCEKFRNLKVHKKFMTLNRAKGFKVLNTSRVYISRQQIFWLPSGLQILFFGNRTGFLRPIFKGIFGSYFRYAWGKILAQPMFHITNLEWNYRNKTTFWFFVWLLKSYKSWGQRSTLGTKIALTLLWLQ